MEVQVIRDFIGRSKRTWVRNSEGKSSQSHIDSVCKSSARDSESSAKNLKHFVTFFFSNIEGFYITISRIFSKKNPDPLLYLQR